MNRSMKRSGVATHISSLLALACALAIALVALVPRTALAATKTTMVTTEAELRQAVALGEAAGTVQLDEDIRLTSPLELGEGSIPTTKVVLNLAGHTLSYKDPSGSTGSNVTVISVYEGSSLTVRSVPAGGKISGEDGGGRGVFNRGTFTLTSGSICDFTKGNLDGAGFMNGAGGNATITGGYIEKNGNPDAQSRKGGGVYNAGTLAMTGGYVRENSLKQGIRLIYGTGGGIYNGSNGILTLAGGNITGNHAVSGGGVYNDGSLSKVLTISGRTQITGNTADVAGGGVYNKSGKVAILGGYINGNNAKEQGGGIYNEGDIAFAAGTVSENTAKLAAGINNNGNLRLSGSPVVEDNVQSDGSASDVYVSSKSYVIVEGKFTTRAHVGIRTVDLCQVFTKGYAAAMGNPEDPTPYFFPNLHDGETDFHIRQITDASDDAYGELTCSLVIRYQDAEGNPHECLNWTDAGQTLKGDGTWYVVRKSNSNFGYITVEGDDVNLILCQGVDLITKGVGILPDKKLTIWSEVGYIAGAYLEADASGSTNAGIGYKDGFRGMGTLVVNGGNIYAKGGDGGAGIGGVDDRGNGPITINNGHVRAFGGSNAAGIGGGKDGDQDNKITINGGQVFAEGAYHAAGIGGGRDGSGGYKKDGRETTIAGGSVIAYGGEGAAAIGGGSGEHGSDVIITGGTLQAMAGKDCATSLGGGKGNGSNGSVEVYDSAKVSSGSDLEHLTPVQTKDRSNAAHAKASRVEPCDHSTGLTYSPWDMWNHEVSGRCSWCSYDPPGIIEEHRFSTVTRICPCGYHQYYVRLMTGNLPAEGGGQKIWSREYVFEYMPDGWRYQLPDTCEVQGMSKDLVFEGWLIDGTLYQGGEWISATKDTNGEAQWSQRRLTYYGAKAATCEEDGNKEYWRRDQEDGTPGAYYVRTDRTSATMQEGDLEVELSGAKVIIEPVEASAVVIDKLGHDWGTPSYTWEEWELQGSTEKYLHCHAESVCTRDDAHVLEEDAFVTPELLRKAPTCTEPGERYAEASFNNELFESQKSPDAYNETVPALGHDWDEPTYEWAQAEDGSWTCTAQSLCRRAVEDGDVADPDHEVLEETVAAVAEVDVEPTCTEPGKTTYTATFKNTGLETPVFTTQTKSVTTPALGHDWGDPTYEWKQVSATSSAGAAGDAGTAGDSSGNGDAGAVGDASGTGDAGTASDTTGAGDAANAVEAGWVCTATRVCKHDPEHEETETVIASVATQTSATCEDAGMDTYTADFTNESFATQIQDVSTPALGHDWGAWEVVMEDGVPKSMARTCSRCSATQAKDVPASHCNHANTVLVPEVPVTCTAQGVKAHLICNDCSALLLEVSEEGATDGTAQGTTLVVVDMEMLKIQPTGHTPLASIIPETGPETPAGCESVGGYNKIYKCQKCKAVLYTSRVVFPALGHDWDKPTYTWSADNSTVTGTRICKNDTERDHVESETVAATRTEVREASCEQGAGATYVSDPFTKPAFEVQTKKVYEDPLGHYWQTPTYTWADDHSSVTARRVCSRDETHVETETAYATSKTLVGPTCTEKGSVTYEASFTNPAFKAQTTTVELAATGHVWGESSYVWTQDDNGDWTCTAQLVCLRDAGHVVDETVIATATEDKAATCTEPGRITYTATFTNAGLETPTFTAQTKFVITPALDHDWGEPTYVWADDNSSVTAKRVCTRDSAHVETETVSVTALPHPASCEQGGGTTYVSASFKNRAFKVQTKEVSTEPFGHDWGQPTYAWVRAANGSWTCTAQRVCLRDADHVESATGTVSATVNKAATCTEPGKTTYTATFTKEGFETQAKVVTTPALGHEWGDPDYAWTQAADGSWTCTAQRVCSNDESHVETEVSRAFTVTDELPSCEEPGKATCIATFENADFETQTQEVAIPALGHDWDAPTYAWIQAANGDWTCTAQRVCLHDADHVDSATATVSATVNKAATCTEPGKTTYTATFANEGPGAPVFTPQTKSVTTPALGHDWGEPTYSWTQVSVTSAAGDVGWVCTATHVCTRDPEHKETETVVASASKTVKEPSCTEPGEVTYTAAFENDDFDSQSKDASIPALGHDWGEWVLVMEDDVPKSMRRACSRCDLSEAKDVPSDPECNHTNTVPVDEVSATCTTQGVKAHLRCNTCRKDLLYVKMEGAAGDEAQTRKLVVADAAMLAILPTGHTPLALIEPVAGEVTEPTCEDIGGYNNEYACEKCGEVLYTSRVVVPALGHDWGDPDYAWSEDNSSVTATRICKHDDKHVETETVDATATAQVAKASCEQGAGATYVSASFENEAFEIQTKKAYGAPLGHDWQAPTYTWYDDHAYAIARRVCSRDENHVETELAHATVNKIQEPTCTEQGSVTYDVSFKSPAFAAQTATVELEATGHQSGEMSYENEVSPTCTKSGHFDAVLRCTTCGAVLERETVEEGALGHDWGEWVTVREPTYAEPGKQRNVCKRCGLEDIYIMPPLDHDHEIERVARVEPTCTETGMAAHYRCKLCNALFSDAAGATAATKASLSLPALGHDWGAWTVTKQATTSEEGVETRTCRHDPSHVETRAIPKLKPNPDPTPDPKPSPSPDDSSTVSYGCVDGGGQRWVQGSGVSLSFSYRRSVDEATTFSHFKGVELDGKLLDPSSYDARSGSVIIELKPDYLGTLSVGAHTLQALFDDGKGQPVSFEVAAAKAETKPTPGGTSGTNTGTNSGSGSGTASSSGAGTGSSAASVKTSTAQTPSTGDPTQPATPVALSSLAVTLILIALSLRHLRHRPTE